jgi:glycerol dehydrogenase
MSWSTGGQSAITLSPVAPAGASDRADLDETIIPENTSSNPMARQPSEYDRGRGIGTARKTFESPGDYWQGRGVTADVGAFCAEMGGDALLIADEIVMDVVGDTVEESLADHGVPYVTEEFNGESSVQEIRRLTDVAAENGVDTVIGAGGGKTLDTAKAIGEELDIAVVSMATIASMDSPTSALSVIYSEDGEWEDYWFHSSHPDLVLVDTEVVAEAPVHFLTSGIADAMATWFEVDASYKSDGTNMARFDGHPTRLAHAVSKLCYEIVRDHGEAAVRAVKQDAVTENVEAVVEANVLLSGLGFENGGVAAAHSVHNGLTELDAAHGATHGEKVNFGVLTQLALEGRDDEIIEDLLDFSATLGLPTTLADLGVEDPSESDLERVARSAVATEPYEETIHNAFDIDWRDVRDAMVAADAIGRAYGSD